MMDAITDQGEGSTLVQRLGGARGEPAADQVRSTRPTPRCKSDYPSYSDGGQPEPSADAAARSNDISDHYECFQEIMALLRQTRW